MSYGDFTCAYCKGEFEKAIPDEEAMQETKEVFGDIPQSECAIVCDDCYKMMIKIQPPTKCTRSA